MAITIRVFKADENELLSFILDLHAKPPNEQTSKVIML